MSIAKKCDRCGRLYEQYNYKNDTKKINGLMTLNIDSGQHYFSHGPYDLCPECGKEFMDWFKGGDENHEDNSSVGQ